MKGDKAIIASHIVPSFIVLHSGEDGAAIAVKVSLISAFEEEESDEAEDG